MHDWIHGTDGHFIWTMRQMVQLLADAQAMEVFDKAAHVFDGELARRDRRQFLSQPATVRSIMRRAKSSIGSSSTRR
jgi:hypothetical protein